MTRTILQIDGMACGMCEAHINDAVRRAFQVKKVSSSHKKGQTEILSEEPLDEEKLKKTIAATGYQVVSLQAGPYEKKGFSFFSR
ncbi:MAG TPA: cation transporter [Candidatus Acetatifactor stercoripullorum]|mgnify:CR=1 FL=1|uniref:Cation transporter n=1 Tax=Candidatus Acetatifactor stercoripullorum TaxID=2838414 RepID=A0A9D1R3N3_9FIRM|nr:heavy-metal-associated domain-containing protein [Candidatus Acetatifactor stercoripullorum]HIW80387.1 cation transporter [Candidatus Acetatifactor stercoripullorum]